MRALGLVIVAACGSSNPPTPSGPPAPIESPRAAPDDTIVAQVNGRPVWSSCVVAQARRGASKAVAFQQCVDFELMAQAAAQRGLATHPDVIDATRTAMVSQLVAVYEDGFRKPADFGGNWARLSGMSLWRVKHEEYRASAYVRISLAADAPQAQVDAAQATVNRIADVLAPERGLLGPQMLELAQAAAGPTKLDHEDVPAYRIGGFADDRYGKALFAIPELGRTSPAIRTKWGFDVIAWTDDVPAVAPSDAEVVEQLLPDVKRAFFTTWVDRISRELGTHLQLFPQNIDKLEAQK